MRPRTHDRKSKGRNTPVSTPSEVIPRGELQYLRVSDIKPSTTNPRLLFDKAPLNELRENIRQNGVLVPITVYEIVGQQKYAIVDGERRYRCCVELNEKGIDITIPANIVAPPTKIAGILYMFSIHNFREQWELMPTALSLQTVMDTLKEHDTTRLSKLTGLSTPQIERCKILLLFPKRFQDLSLDPDSRTRIPSNFWIELFPLLDLCERVLPKLVKEIGRDGITDKLVEKYRAKRVKSVLHFRRVIEAFELFAEDKEQENVLGQRLLEYISDVQFETRKAFDEFIVDNRRILSAIEACDDFTQQLERAKLEHTLEREELSIALRRVKEYVEKLLQSLEGTDPPRQDDTDEDS